MKAFQSKLLTVITAAMLCLAMMASCGAEEATQDDQTVSHTGSDFIADYTDRDLDPSWDSATAIYIELADGGSATSGRGATIAGDVVTITAEGTYVLSGALSNGQIIVDADSETKIQIVLNGVDIHCGTGPGIYIKSADKVFLTLEADSVNSVRDAADYVLAAGEDEPYAAIFSKDDLTINGAGSLSVTGSYRIGIASKDDLVITGGTINVTAVGDAVRGRDCVKIWDVALTIDAGEDGIQSNNDEDAALGYVYIDGGSYAIAAGNDGIQAESYLRVTGGSGTITTGGGSANAVSVANDVPGFGGQMPGGMPQQTTAETDDAISVKGLKAGGQIYICGGDFTLDCVDDTVHSNGNITISGGSYQLATGDDGIHADGALVIDDGVIDITRSYEGLEGLSVTINGGTISIVASDDGINATDGTTTMMGMMGGGQVNEDVYIEISGGYIVIDATGDGQDSNGNLYINGGVVLVNGPANSADAALDYEGTATIKGGVVMFIGPSGMALGFSNNSAQAGFMYTYGTTQQAGTTVTVVDSSGEIVAHYVSLRSFNNIVVSAPSLAQGETYTILSGTTASQVDEYGFSRQGSYSGGTQTGTITLSGVFTSNGQQGQYGQGTTPGGQQGPGGGQGPGGTRDSAAE